MSDLVQERPIGGPIAFEGIRPEDWSPCSRLLQGWKLECRTLSPRRSSTNKAPHLQSHRRLAPDAWTLDQIQRLQCAGEARRCQKGGGWSRTESQKQMVASNFGTINTCQETRVLQDTLTVPFPLQSAQADLTLGSARRDGVSDQRGFFQWIQGLVQKTRG